MWHAFSPDCWWTPFPDCVRPQIGFPTSGRTAAVAYQAVIVECCVPFATCIVSSRTNVQQHHPPSSFHGMAPRSPSSTAPSFSPLFVSFVVIVARVFAVCPLGALWLWVLLSFSLPLVVVAVAVAIICGAGSQGESPSSLRWKNMPQL